MDGSGSYDEQESTGEVAELRKSVAELTLKLQNSTFQKKRLERELEGVVSENSNLSRTLERTESELAELQLKLEEEATETCASKETAVSPGPTTPLSPFQSSSFTSSGGTRRHCSVLPVTVTAPSLITLRSLQTASRSSANSTRNTALFSRASESCSTSVPVRPV